MRFVKTMESRTNLYRFENVRFRVNVDNIDSKIKNLLDSVLIINKKNQLKTKIKFYLQKKNFNIEKL